MTFYNMLFGKNPQTNFLLATIGLKEVDVERFRDVFFDSEHERIAVYTRTGGNNRADYPQIKLYKNPLFISTVDDDFDNTYCRFYFKIPEEFIEDVKNLSDILTHGLRPLYVQHIARTLRREPTPEDIKNQKYEEERLKLKGTRHVMANGHTFVPYDDQAMKAALELAEANNGELRTCWGILPLKLPVHINLYRFGNSKNPDVAKDLERVAISYAWEIDVEYWEHCRSRWLSQFPKTMAIIGKAVQRMLKDA